LDLHFENWIWIGEGEDWYGSKSLERGESFLKVRERDGLVVSVGVLAVFGHGSGFSGRFCVFSFLGPVS
jgi:hypothetical protein